MATERYSDHAGRLVKVVQSDPDGTGPATRPTYEYAYEPRGLQTL